MTEHTQACPLCGAPETNGLDDCLSAFSVLGQREFSDPAFFAFHRLTVDAYCLQHPERYMVSTKSAATHLAAMCWTMEHGLSRHLPRRLKMLVDGPKNFARLEPPACGQRGVVTVADVVNTSTLRDYETQAWTWARSAWEAWSDHWDQAREWVAAARGNG